MGSIFQEAAMGLDYVELPDLSLSALQKRFTLPSELEELYQRYEQRFQVGKCYNFPFFLGRLLFIEL